MALQPMWRVQVTVPLAALEAVRAGILAVDRLAAGGYDSGLFEHAVGIEQFRPLPGSSPALGEVGQGQRVPAVIVQFHLPPDQARLQRIIEHGIAPHHPWCSPVIEVSAVWLWLDPPGPAAPAQSTPA